MSEHAVESVPTILVVGMASSPHTARWINCVRRAGFRFVIFPSVLVPPSADLEPWRIVRNRADVEQLAVGEVGVLPWEEVPRVDPQEVGAELLRDTYPSWIPTHALPHARGLRDVIEDLQPAMVHSMECLAGGYLVLEARRRWPRSRAFPPWLVSSWGGDVFIARQFERHKPILLDILRTADALQADCARDIDWAIAQGFAGYAFPQMPASGGADLATFPDPASLLPPSQRKLIVLKGYHSWAGRALHLLLAVHRIASRLKGFRIEVTHATPPVADMVERLRVEDGLDIAVAPYLPSNLAALERLGSARLAVGYGIADGIATTLLEAMTVGTFMVQADTCCGHEWVTHGRTGLIVPAHDVVALSEAILIAATEDALVDLAVAENRATVEARWNAKINGPRIAEAYRELIHGGVHVEG